MADAVHEGLKLLGPDEQCWDVWLQPKPMAALRAWRESLDVQDWGRAAYIGGQIAGGSKVTSNSLLPWRMATGGYELAVPNAAFLQRRAG